MKSFFQTFLAVLAANLVYTIISFFIGIIFIVVLVASFAIGSSTNAKVDISSSTVLTISLANTYEYQAFSDNQTFNLGLNGKKAITAWQLENLIYQATKDDNIKAILVEDFGLAQQDRVMLDNLVKALAHFKKADKPVYAYANNFSEKVYKVASLANKIYMHPQGNFEWDGMSLRYTFYKRLMDKVGVEAQILYAGNFKSATEPFRNTKMSDYNKLQMQTIIDSIYDRFLVQVGHNRNISKATLKQYANNLDVVMASDALDKKMVDELAMYTDVKKDIKSMVAGEEVEDDDVQLIPIEKYASQFSNYTLLNTRFDQDADNHIGILYMTGQVTNNLSSKTPFMPKEKIISESLVKQIEDMEDDDDIKAVVVVINSPGGSAQVSETIWDALKKLKQAKPLVFSMGAVAASGGYYIASIGDKIIASPQTITGSIGVFAMIPTAPKFFKDKLYLDYDEVKTTEHVFDMSSILNKKLDKLQLSRIQEGVDNVYSIFLQRVALGRKMKTEEVHKIAQGRVWGARRALEVGLIDGIGNEYDAIKVAAKLAKLPSFSVSIYNEEQNWINGFVNQFSQKVFFYLGLNTFFESTLYQSWIETQELEMEAGKIQAKLPIALDNF